MKLVVVESCSGKWSHEVVVDGEELDALHYGSYEECLGFVAAQALEPV